MKEVFKISFDTEKNKKVYQRKKKKKQKLSS